MSLVCSTFLTESTTQDHSNWNWTHNHGNALSTPNHFYTGTMIEKATYIGCYILPLSSSTIETEMRWSLCYAGEAAL